MAALLEVKGLKAFYGQTQSLYDVSFDIATGGITLVDDPTDARAYGAASHDGEGLAWRKSAAYAAVRRMRLSAADRVLRDEPRGTFALYQTAGLAPRAVR